MKKYICLLMVMVIFAITACSTDRSENDAKDKGINTKNEEMLSVDEDFSGDESSKLIEEGQYYRIYYVAGKYDYSIYDENNQLVRTEETDRPRAI